MSLFRRRRRQFSLDATRTLVDHHPGRHRHASGGYWLVRGVESDKIVNEGTGVVEQPGITCTQGLRTGPVCINHVKVLVDASQRLITQTDVNGLYKRAETSLGMTFDLQKIYVDTTNNQVNRSSTTA